MLMLAARAGLLGDVRSNHPGNWPLPKRNWPTPAAVNGLPAQQRRNLLPPGGHM